MAAGLGFKDFVTGEVLTAADVDGYLMQGVWVFASAAARDAAVTSPQEGNFAYLKDTNVTTYYTGSAWANLDTTGMTNPMTTTGDIIYSSPGSTPVRLGIGSNGNVLTVASGVPSWAAATSGGGLTLLSTTTLSGATTTISSIDQNYKDLLIIVQGVNKSVTHRLYLNPNNVNNASSGTYPGTNNTGAFEGTSYVQSSIQLCPRNYVVSANTNNAWAITLYNYASSSFMKAFSIDGTYRDDAGYDAAVSGGGGFRSTTAISSLVFDASSGNFNAGTVLVYGVK